mgnify:CR=1 FL=1
MIKRCFLTFLLLLTVVNLASAQAVKLTGEEIRNLLTGNTAIGRLEGVSYRQYFGEDGGTIFAENGSKSKVGKWRVDDTELEFQSIWTGDIDWEGWFVMEYGKTYYWVSRETPPTPFQILIGKQLAE